MAKCTIQGAKIRGVMSSVPSWQLDSLTGATRFLGDEVRMVVGLILVADGGLSLEGG